jgi:hypothetical protein
MPKRIADLLSPDSLPQRQPHAAIVEILNEDPALAYTPSEIVGAVCSRLASWRITGEMPTTQQIAVTHALDDLLQVGVIVELWDGAERHYGLQSRAP